MTLPQILVDLMKLLFDMAVPVAICTMVLAGMALRQEGGVNFETGGRFQRWALWSVIMLTLPQFLSWFAAQGISMPPQGGNISSAWVNSVETSFYRLRFERCGRTANSSTRRILHFKGGARCSGGTQPARVDHRRDLLAVGVRHGAVDAGLE